MGNLTESDVPVALPKYIRAKAYARMTGISEAAIKNKRIEGVWREGIEWIKAPDGNIMIDWRAVDQWAESHTPLPATPLSRPSG